MSISEEFPESGEPGLCTFTMAFTVVKNRVPSLAQEQTEHPEEAYLPRQIHSKPRTLLLMINRGCN